MFQAQTKMFKEYQQQVLKNAKSMAKALIDLGYSIVSGMFVGRYSYFFTIQLSYRNSTGLLALYIPLRTICISIIQGSHGLEKSLNFRGSPWKVLKCLCKSLKSPWISFNFECSGLEIGQKVLFACPRQSINYSYRSLRWFT